MNNNLPEDNKKKIISSLKKIAIIQGIILVIVVFVLLFNIIDYNYLGETQFVWEDEADCSTTYGCECHLDSCRCIHYNDNKNRQEYVKCSRTINND